MVNCMLILRNEDNMSYQRMMQRLFMTSLHTWELGTISFKHHKCRHTYTYINNMKMKCLTPFLSSHLNTINHIELHIHQTHLINSKVFKP